jgi:hypothetical protein
MFEFRQFEAGPDPFGRTFQVYFKWLQTAIALRHSDTVDVRFVLESGGAREEKTVALPYAALQALQHPLTDPWCARIAALHLRSMIATGEDLEKPLVEVSAAGLAVHAAEVARLEAEAVARR